MTNNNLLPEAICCCLQGGNAAVSEVMVGYTRVPSLIVIGTAINQLETKVSLKTICCLRLLILLLFTNM